MAEPSYLDAGATFSEDGRFRYRLWRVWDRTLPRVAFVMLNPSTADAKNLDPTLRRCLAFAQQWGCGSFDAGNLYALRSTDPRALQTDLGDVVGPENDAHLTEIAKDASFGVVAGWGANARRSRADAAVDLLHRYQNVLRVGALTAAGFPRHPLYTRGDLAPRVHRKKRFT